PQADGVLEQPGESAGADEQPRGADQPVVPVPGEGAVQVAPPPDAGAVRGPEAQRGLEPLESARSPQARSPEVGRTSQVTAPGRSEVRSSCVRIGWRSARSLEILALAFLMVLLP